MRFSNAFGKFKMSLLLILDDLRPAMSHMFGFCWLVINYEQLLNIWARVADPGVHDD